MSLEGTVIAITGKLSMPRNDLVNILEQKGGQFAASITKKVTHLVCSSHSGTKYNKAVKQGVAIVTEDFIHSAESPDTGAKRPSPTEDERPIPTQGQMRTGNEDPLVGEMAAFITKMISTNSNLEKQTEFKKLIDSASDDFKELLKIIYTKQIKFGVTSKNIVKFETSKWEDSFYEKMPLLEYIRKLVNAELTGHNALKVAVSFLKDNSSHRKTLLLIFNKDIKIRFGLKQVNKVIPGFVPEFSVSLGKLYDDKTKNYVEKGDWYMSKKLDGVRCITIVTDIEGNPSPKVEFYSRQGLKFQTLGKVEDEIQKYWGEIKTNLASSKGTNSIVLDGEMCVLKEDGSEDFKLIMKEIRRKDHQVDKPRYLIFDMLTPNEFYNGTSTRLFSERLGCIKKTLPYIEFDKPPDSNRIIMAIPQLTFEEEAFTKMSAHAEDKGWEGLMLRKDTEYKGKRSNDLLKVKQFYTEEYVVKSVVEDDILVINKDTGLQETIKALGSVVIHHEGMNTITKQKEIKVVNVGSGFSQEERVLYNENPNLIIGKTISVQFFEFVRSKDGKEGLRFPTFKGLYGTKRTI